MRIMQCSSLVLRHSMRNLMESGRPSKIWGQEIRFNCEWWSININKKEIRNRLSRRLTDESINRCLNFSLQFQLADAYQLPHYIYKENVWDFSGSTRYSIPWLLASSLEAKQESIFAVSIPIIAQLTSLKLIKYWIYLSRNLFRNCSGDEMMKKTVQNLLSYGFDAGVQAALQALLNHVDKLKLSNATRDGETNEISTQ